MKRRILLTLLAGVVLTGCVTRKETAEETNTPAEISAKPEESPVLEAEPELTSEPPQEAEANEPSSGILDYVTLDGLLEKEDWNGYTDALTQGCKSLGYEYLAPYITYVTSNKSAVVEKHVATPVVEEYPQDSYYSLTLIQYDSKGNTISCSIYDYSEDKPSIYDISVSVIDLHNTKIYECSGYDTTVYQKSPVYDEYGRITELEYSCIVKEDGRKLWSEKTHYIYLDDYSDGLYEDISIDLANDNEQTFAVLCDRGGKILYESNGSAGGDFTYFSVMGTGQIYHYYDNEGKHIREKAYFGDNGAQNIMYTDYTYDEAGNCIDKYVSNSDGTFVEHIRREYNEYGDMTASYDYFDGKEVKVEENSYVYDENGRILEREYFSAVQQSARGTDTFEYYLK